MTSGGSSRAVSEKSSKLYRADDGTMYEYNHYVKLLPCVRSKLSGTCGAGYTFGIRGAHIDVVVDCIVKVFISVFSSTMSGTAFGGFLNAVILRVR